ncbi:transglutaminase domain-containing protein [Candidatus Woesearchaeota archaeon]|nr:transglutaminase domain-containing protein [Candidatus Woesearchaeota archaeon]
MKLFSKQFLAKFGDIVDRHLLSYFQQNVNRYYSTKTTNIENLQEFCQRQLRSEIAQNLAKDFTGSNDEKIIQILRFVHKLLTYKTDNEVWQLPEYWQDFNETYRIRVGDCEDGSNMILTLARLSGISPARVFLRVGDVRDPSNSANILKHAWVVYRSDDRQLFNIDWTYYFDDKSIDERYSARYQKSYYKTRDFDINDTNSLGMKITEWGVDEI